VQALANRLADGRRQTDRTRIGLPDRRERSLVGKEADNLCDEERVSARLSVDCCYQLGGCTGAGDEIDEARDIALGEPGEWQTPASRRTLDVGQGWCQGMVAADFDVSVGTDQEDARVAKLPRQEREEQDRGSVRPMEIVEHEDQRPVCGGRTQQDCDRVEEAETCRFGFAGRRYRQTRQPFAQHGNDLGDFGTAGAEVGPQ